MGESDLNHRFREIVMQPFVMSRPLVVLIDENSNVSAAKRLWARSHISGRHMRGVTC